MKKKDTIALILEYYNEIKQIAKEHEQRFKENDDYGRGELCAMRYILIEVYGFKTNDKRF